MRDSSDAADRVPLTLQSMPLLGRMPPKPPPQVKWTPVGLGLRRLQPAQFSGYCYQILHLIVAIRFRWPQRAVAAESLYASPPTCPGRSSPGGIQ